MSDTADMVPTDESASRKRALHEDDDVARKCAKDTTLSDKELPASADLFAYCMEIAAQHQVDVTARTNAQRENLSYRIMETGLSRTKSNDTTVLVVPVSVMNFYLKRPEEHYGITEDDIGIVKIDTVSYKDEKHYVYVVHTKQWFPPGTWRETKHRSDAEFPLTRAVVDRWIDHAAGMKSDFTTEYKEICITMRRNSLPTDMERIMYHHVCIENVTVLFPNDARDQIILRLNE